MTDKPFYCPPEVYNNLIGLLWDASQERVVVFGGHIEHCKPIIETVYEAKNNHHDPVHNYALGKNQWRHILRKVRKNCEIVIGHGHGHVGEDNYYPSQPDISIVGEHQNMVINLVFHKSGRLCWYNAGGVIYEETVKLDWFARLVNKLMGINNVP